LTLNIPQIGIPRLKEGYRAIQDRSQFARIQLVRNLDELTPIRLDNEEGRLGAFVTGVAVTGYRYHAPTRLQ
jgi:hypothetical protein